MSSIPLDVEQTLMSAGTARFLEPYLDRVCFCCAAKGRWSRNKKLLHCDSCHTDFMPLPDGSLAIYSRPHVSGP